jgi:ribosomal protein L44E
MSWKVVTKPDTVRLYCPECWDGAKKIIEKYVEQQNENS